MELNKVIDTRRSIRKYLNKEVPKNLLIEAINDGIKAPSAHNRQPWKFKILSKTEKNKLAKTLLDCEAVKTDANISYTAKVIEEVPEIIMVFIDNTDKKNRDMDIISIGACIENIILSLTNKGLGTLWIGYTNCINEEIKKMYNIPYEPISTIAIGYQNQFPNPRPRKDITETLL